MAETCEHYAALQPVTSRANGCEECLAIGATWTELRVCLNCGHVGCCEDSKHAHALKHFNATAHPMIASYERGDTWSWCYVHRRYMELTSALVPRRRSLLAALFGRRAKRDSP
ncbi:MAG: UBP-type zinc finger domain-containing protein [Casimicrobiaceae bacterium]